MDFEFTAEEKAWRQQVGNFFQEHCRPDKVERLKKEQQCTNPYDHELYMAMQKNGMFGVGWPKDYGGRALPKMYEAMILEEMGYWEIPLGTWNVFVNTVVFLGNSMMRLATEEQRRKWAPRILSGEFRTSNGITEPEAGTDAAAAATTALANGDNYVVNGTKIFNNAHRADWITAVVRTDPKAPKHKGLSILLIDLRTPGVTVRPTYTTMGGWLRGEVSFDDALVPRSNIIGQENKGWDYLRLYLAEERVSLAWIGKCRRIITELRDWVKSDAKLASNPGLRHALADTWIDLEVSTLLSYWAIWSVGQGSENAAELGMSKVGIAEAANRMSNNALEILGICGQLTDASSYKKWLPLHGKVAEWYADIRVDQVAGGSSEVLRNQMAYMGLGLPRK